MNIEGACWWARPPRPYWRFGEGNVRSNVRLRSSLTTNCLVWARVPAFRGSLSSTISSPGHSFPFASCGIHCELSWGARKGAERPHCSAQPRSHTGRLEHEPETVIAIRLPTEQVQSGGGIERTEACRNEKPSDGSRMAWPAADAGLGGCIRPTTPRATDGHGRCGRSETSRVGGIPRAMIDGGRPPNAKKGATRGRRRGRSRAQ